MLKLIESVNEVGLEEEESCSDDVQSYEINEKPQRSKNPTIEKY